MTILEKVRINAKTHPEQYVIRTQLESGELVLKWGDLDEMSDKLASYFNKTLKTNTPVIIYGHKNPMMIVLFLACVKSGRAYCPIDINVPMSRTEAIIKEVNPEIIVTTEILAINDDRLKTMSDINAIIASADSSISEDNYVKAEDVFYIIFTSGSTGIPKGVQITRDCLDSFIRWAVMLGDGFQDGNSYIFLNQAPFSFDLSVMDLYLCLYTGGTLWALSKEVQTNMKRLYDSLEKSRLNIWVSTPSFANVCLSDPVFSKKILPDLTSFIFCGEILTNKTVDRLKRRFLNVAIVNTYGPTESTCAVTEVCITDEVNTKYSPLPVGKPKKGTWIRIVDDKLCDVPDGEKGEIVIVGDSVSVGYWDNEERNRESFGVTSIENNIFRYYRTGDEGYISDGLLFYCGRIDNQVKLHGYRIELEDIENNILKIEGVIQAVVLPKYRDNKVSSLVAGIVLTSGYEAESEDVQWIKDELKKLLPEYMIPKIIKIVSSIPRTNNGKVDRKAMGDIL